MMFSGTIVYDLDKKKFTRVGSEHTTFAWDNYPDWFGYLIEKSTGKFYKAASIAEAEYLLKREELLIQPERPGYGTEGGIR